MFQIHVLQEQWLFLGFGGGLILMLGIVLVYTAGWRPRGKEREEGEIQLKTFENWLRWGRATFPWILILTLLGVALWSILYPLFYHFDTPNW